MDDVNDGPVLRWLAEHPSSHALLVCPTGAWARNRGYAIAALAKTHGVRVSRRGGDWRELVLESGATLRAVGVGTALGGRPYYAAFIDPEVRLSCPRVREWWMVEAQSRLAPDAPVWPPQPWPAPVRSRP